MIGPVAFGAPALLLALALVPVVWGALRYAERRRAAADREVGGPAALRRGRSSARRRLRGVLLVAAIAAALLAAARPQWGEEQRSVEQRGIDVALVLDVSRSMTATDVEPSRAHAAAGALTGLLGGLVGDRAALVTFAGSALVRSPLTRDLEVLAQLVERAQSEAALMRPGSNVGVALQRALDALNVDDAARTQAIVLISDGEDPAGNRFVDFARETATARGVRIYTAVAGAPGGGALPGAERREGGSEVSVPDTALLADAARGTGGELRSLSSIPGLAVAFRRLAQTRFAEDRERAPIERFQWGAAIALALLGARELVAEGGRGRGGRGRPRLLAALSASVLLALGAALVASCGGSEAYRETRAGNDAYQADRYEKALLRYEAAAQAAPTAEDLAILAYDRGNALGRLERYEEAMEAAARAADETEDPELAAVAAYARGTHAARALRLEAARDAFVTALLRDPDDDDARANLEIVLRALGAAAAPEPTPAAGTEGGGGQPGPAPGVPGGAAGPPPPDATPGSPGNAPGTPGPGGSATAQPGVSPVPGGSAAPAGVAGAQPGPGGAALSAEEARAALEAALAELASGEMALEEALRILDLVHQLNALVDLGAAREPGGALPPR